MYILNSSQYSIFSYFLILTLISQLQAKKQKKIAFNSDSNLIRKLILILTLICVFHIFTGLHKQTKINIDKS